MGDDDEKNINNSTMRCLYLYDGDFYLGNR